MWRTLCSITFNRSFYRKIYWWVYIIEQDKMHRRGWNFYPGNVYKLWYQLIGIVVEIWAMYKKEAATLSRDNFHKSKKKIWESWKTSSNPTLSSLVFSSIMLHQAKNFWRRQIHDYTCCLSFWPFLFYPCFTLEQTIFETFYRSANKVRFLHYIRNQQNISERQLWGVFGFLKHLMLFRGKKMLGNFSSQQNHFWIGKLRLKQN